MRLNLDWSKPLMLHFTLVSARGPPASVVFERPMAAINCWLQIKDFTEKWHVLLSDLTLIMKVSKAYRTSLTGRRRQRHFRRPYNAAPSPQRHRSAPPPHNRPISRSQGKGGLVTSINEKFKSIRHGPFRDAWWIHASGCLRTGERWNVPRVLALTWITDIVVPWNAGEGTVYVIYDWSDICQGAGRAVH